ncbi:hypothetical protein ACIP72_10530 [Streptomyces cyaneofuscatus]|uniref:hypothetical protein n=1 Tax=Streptomyces cyaneofuscatus TaxID=66883 RepID=UPI00341C453E
MIGGSGGTPVASAVRALVAYRASVPDRARSGRRSWKTTKASARSGLPDPHHGVEQRVAPGGGRPLPGEPVPVLRVDGVHPGKAGAAGVPQAAAGLAEAADQRRDLSLGGHPPDDLRHRREQGLVPRQIRTVVRRNVRAHGRVHRRPVRHPDGEQQHRRPVPRGHRQAAHHPQARPGRPVGCAQRYVDEGRRPVGAGQVQGPE